MQLQKIERLEQLPKRPRGSYALKFRSMNITTNHFHVKVDNFQSIHIFSVKYNPMIPLDNVVLRRKMLEEGRDKLKIYIESPVISGNNIYSTKASLSEEFEVQVGDYKISVKQVKVLNVKQNPKLLLSFLNNGLRSIMRRLDYMEIGRSGKYFNTKEKKDIDSLWMFNGYKSNFVLLENGFYLRVDSAKKIVRNQTVLQYIDEVYKIHQDKEKEERRLILQGELTGKIVMTNYGKTCYHRIDELIFQDLDSVQIEDAHISLRDYYQTKYNITIKNNKQPLLKVESKRRNKEMIIYLIPELCLMTGIPEHFDEFRRKKISEQTIKPADEKQREILKLMNELKSNDEYKSLREIGISIKEKLETIRGKIIPMPRINLGENQSIEEGKEAFFNLFNKPIYGSKHNIRCGIIYFAGQETRPLLDTFESTSRNLRVKMESIKLNAGEFDSRKALSMIEAMLKKAIDKEGCNICLIILPNQLKTQYKKIKILALLKSQIICQITTEGTLRKKNLQSIATKILLQIIAKRGNTLWVPKIPSGLPATMMVAFESAKSGSVTTVSMCATLNSTFTSIFSRTSILKGSDNKFTLLGSLAMQAATAYVARNKEPPAQIIFFHASTSGDQIVMFQDYFVAPLKEHLKSAYLDRVPAVTLIMVNVKTSERFFTEGDNVRNVPAGTLISSEIVSNYYDFYVVSQASNRGSTLPNHYKVIYSDSKMEEGMLQQLVFSQCFNYVNWTGSIKVPGILQYADRCAKFNSEVLENEILCEDLQSKLYFV